jgi:hypothetical protein
MSIAEIRSLPLREKLQIMEEIWEDLRPHAKTSEVPPEHRQILDLRRDRAISGQATLRSWDEVKHSIGKR